MTARVSLSILFILVWIACDPISDPTTGEDTTGTATEGEPYLTSGPATSTTDAEDPSTSGPASSTTSG